MKSEVYKQRLDAANGNPTEIAVVMGEQTADLIASLQLKLIEETTTLRAENAAIRAEVAALRAELMQARQAGVR